MIDSFRKMCDFFDKMTNDSVVALLFILAATFILIERIRLRKNLDTVRIVEPDSDSSIPPTEKRDSDQNLH